MDSIFGFGEAEIFNDWKKKNEHIKSIHSHIIYKYIKTAGSGEITRIQSITHRKSVKQKVSQKEADAKQKS